MKVKYKKLKENAIEPFHGSEYSAGYDLFSCCDVIIRPQQNEVVKTGIALEIPDGYFGAIYARSGLAKNLGLRPANCVGVIDSDYRGEICVVLYNDSTEYEAIIESGERIAQLVISPYLPVEFEEHDELGDTDRGAGGFGSTGK